MTIVRLFVEIRRLTETIYRFRNRWVSSRVVRSLRSGQTTLL